ncbi:tetratricopeptide repeat protein [Thermococcus gammatolerans]|nr:tetratricopeptide repeat protein [Thermococcus gammatolerans]
MWMERIEEYVRRNRVDEAVRLILSEGDGVVKAELLAELLKRVIRLDDYRYVKGELLKCRYEAPDRKTKALILSVIGEALFSSGDEKEGVKFFREAMSVARGIGVETWRAEALIGVALNLVRAGFYDDALYLFSEAFEAITVLEGEEPEKALRLLRKLADSMVFSVEWIDSGEWAVEFFNWASEVYEHAGLGIPAKTVRAKAALIERAIAGDVQFLRRILAEDWVDGAVLMARYMPPEKKGSAFLEISFWLLANGRRDLGEQVFNDAIELLSRFGASDKYLSSIAFDFVKLGYPDLALRLVRLIRSDELSSRVLARVAVEYLREGDELMARTITLNIPNESIKSKVLQQIGGGGNVGYEQGLPLTRG